MTDAGVVLEARVQRLFLAQGLFAERSLFPAADVGHRLLATDIDVLVSEYSSGFHLTRRHAECKTGKVRILDRILWLNGVRAMLGADASYLVLQSFDEDASTFARSLNIDVMTLKQLEIWEKALNIPKQQWPNRSDVNLFEPIRKQALDLGREKGSHEWDKIVREAIQFNEIDSWRVFGYGRLNQLLRMLKTLSEMPDAFSGDEGRTLHARYCASALLVRLSQYLLAVCHDVNRVPISDIQSYLFSRLTFGDQDPTRARGLVQNTVDWISEALKQHGMTMPLEVDSNRLFQPPSYSEGLVGLINKLLASPHAARHLPVAIETEQFGRRRQVEMFPRLRVACNAARSVAALVKSFALASVGVNSWLLAPLWADVDAPPQVRPGGKGESIVFDPAQTELNLLDC